MNLFTRRRGDAEKKICRASGMQLTDLTGLAAADAARVISAKSTISAPPRLRVNRPSFFVASSRRPANILQAIR
jgi:hypothetical protein